MKGSRGAIAANPRVHQPDNARSTMVRGVFDQRRAVFHGLPDGRRPGVHASAHHRSLKSVVAAKTLSRFSIKTGPQGAGVLTLWSPTAENSHFRQQCFILTKLVNYSLAFPDCFSKFISRASQTPVFGKPVTRHSEGSEQMQTAQDSRRLRRSDATEALFMAVSLGVPQIFTITWRIDRAERGEWSGPWW